MKIRLKTTTEQVECAAARWAVWIAFCLGLMMGVALTCLILL